MNAWPDTLIRSVGSVTSLVAHTLIFIASLVLIFAGFEAATVMLVLTTAVSLEAIYLSILIQMALNRQAAALAGVEEDIDEIQEDIEEIGEDIDEIQEDVDEIQEDVEEIQEEVVEEDPDPSIPPSSLEEIEADLAKIASRIASLRERR